jgi:hypothetical protein
MQMRTLPVLAVTSLLAAAGSLGSAAPSSVSAAGAAYVTIQFGRSIEGSYTGPGCVPVPGILRLGQAVADLHSLGRMAVGTVNIDRASTASEDCTNGDIYANWTDLHNLNTSDGFQVVSEGLNHHDITNETLAEQQAESCGSLPDFSNEGFTRAWGEFAYPDDKSTTAIQTNVVSTCFAYGRAYSYTPTINVRSLMAAPWFEKADNVLGGECNVSTLPCFSLTTTKGRHYTNPSGWARVLKNETANQWDDLQFYQLVTGSSSQSQTFSWDCTSTNWKLHWTSHNEMYCLNDFMTIIAAIQPGVLDVDPATVALAWGRGQP